MRATQPILYTLLLLLPILGTSTAFASATDPLCPFERLAGQRVEAAQFKSVHLESEYHVPANNEAFYKRVVRTEMDDRTVFLQVENAVLKLLNDKVFLDKELSASTLNLYKKLFFEQLKADDYLWSRIPKEDGIYSDYKYIRLAVIPKNPTEIDAIEQRLTKLLESVSLAFASEMKSYPRMAGFYDGLRGLVGDPSHWNLAGIGHTAEQASVESRRARKPEPGEARQVGVPIPPRIFSPRSSLAIAMELDEIESIRQNLISTLNRIPGLLEDGSLSLDAVDLLRKAQSNPSITDRASYEAYLSRRFNQRFQIELTKKEMGLLQRYYQLVQELAPPIFIKEQEPLALAELDKATNGVVSFDFAGQNNVNTVGTFQAFKQAAQVAGRSSDSRERALLAMELAFERQQRESDAFDSSKDVLAAAIAESHIEGRGQNVQHRPKGELTSSGDDSTFLPSAPLNLFDQSRLMIGIKNRWSPPSRFRLTFQPQNFVDSKKAIPNEARFNLISQGESIEKNLREQLEALGTEGLEHGVLKDVLFATRLLPNENGTVQFDILYAVGADAASRQPPHSVWKEKIRKALSQEGVLPHGFELRLIFDSETVAGAEARFRN